MFIISIVIALNFTNLVSFLYSGKENAFNLNGQSNHQDWAVVCKNLLYIMHLLCTCRVAKWILQWYDKYAVEEGSYFLQCTCSS